MRQAFASFQHGFYRSAENVDLQNSVGVFGKTRAIKDAIYIRVNNPPINRNIGKYYLPHIWDEVL